LLFEQINLHDVIIIFYLQKLHVYDLSDENGRKRWYGQEGKILKWLFEYKGCVPL
jgi:hypothetical protein